MGEDGFKAAVAAGVLGADEAYRELLQAIVEVARSIFGAKASTIFLLDRESDELVFEDQLGVVEEPANERRLAIVDRTAGQKAQQPFLRTARTSGTHSHVLRRVGHHQK